MKDFSIMTEKEKDYVSFCLKKNILSQKSEIDYGNILNGLKIDYQFSEFSKKNEKLTFAKQSKKSRKWARPSSNTLSNFMKNQLFLCDLEDGLCFIKNINLETNLRDEILMDISMSMSKELFLLEQFWKFLQKFVDFVEKCDVKEIIFRNLILFFINNYLEIDFLLLYQFFDKNIEKFDILNGNDILNNNDILNGNDILNNNMLNNIHKMFNTPQGIILGTIILLLNPSKGEEILYLFLKCEICQCEYLSDFVKILINLNEEKEDLILKKIK